MSIYSGIRSAIALKGLRGKYAAGPENRLLGFWFDGWPEQPPELPLEGAFYDAPSGTYIYTDIYSFSSYPALLARCVRWHEELLRLGVQRYQVHFAIDTGPGDEDPRVDDELAARLSRESEILKRFMADLCGPGAAAGLFFSINGVYPDDEVKSLCRLLTLKP